MEPEGESALGTLLLHPFSCNGNAEKSSEGATDMVGGMVHKGWTCQPLHNSLTPFHNNILNSILQEKHKNLLGDLVGSIRGGRTSGDTDLYDDRTETPHLLLSWQSMGEEADSVDE